jgi:hypothetical protein
MVWKKHYNIAANCDDQTFQKVALQERQVGKILVQEAGISSVKEKRRTGTL